MNRYLQAITGAGPGDTQSFGSITGTFSASPSTIVWASRSGGTTNVADATYLNLTSGLDGNQIRCLLDDCNACGFGTVYICELGSTPFLATGGWQNKSRLLPFAVGLLIDIAESDQGTITVQERSNNGDNQYFVKFDVAGL
jgi:hypothetical protein